MSDTRRDVELNIDHIGGPSAAPAAAPIHSAAGFNSNIANHDGKEAKHRPASIAQLKDESFGFNKIYDGLDMPAFADQNEVWYEQQEWNAQNLQDMHVIDKRAEAEAQRQIAAAEKAKIEKEKKEAKEKLEAAKENVAAAKENLRKCKRKWEESKTAFAIRGDKAKEAVDARKKEMDDRARENKENRAATLGLARHAKKDLVALLPVPLMPEYQYKPDFELPCTICLLNMDKNPDVHHACLPLCGHGFHQHCIAKVLSSDDPRCPKCRVAISSRWRSEWVNKKLKRAENHITELNERLRKAERDVGATSPPDMMSLSLTS